MSTNAAKTRSNNLIQVRVPEGLKERTAELFESLGTSTSEVIRMMLVEADQTRSIPFKVRSRGYPISAGERIEEIKATFALEDMPLSEQNIQDLKDIELARTTPEAVRERIINDIKKRHGA